MFSIPEKPFRTAYNNLVSEYERRRHQIGKQGGMRQCPNTAPRYRRRHRVRSRVCSYPSAIFGRRTTQKRLIKLPFFFFIRRSLKFLNSASEATRNVERVVTFLSLHVSDSDLSYATKASQIAERLHRRPGYMFRLRSDKFALFVFFFTSRKQTNQSTNCTPCSFALL